MDDFTLAPLLNAAIHANDGIQQLIESPLRAAAAAAALPPSEGGSPKKKAIKKPQSNIANFLKHPNSDGHKLQTNQLLLETASRIHDAILELEIYADILAADGSVLKHRKDNSRAVAANNIRNSIVPLLQITANTLRDAGKCFAPYSGTDRLHERNDVERRRKLTAMNKSQVVNIDEHVSEFEKSPSLLMIDDFVKRSDWSPDWLVQRSSGKSAKKGENTKAASAASNSVTLLKPRNGSTYTKSEVIAIANQHRKGTRGKIFRAMIQKGFVPCSKSALHRLMQKVEKGEEVMETEWSTAGRPSLMFPDNMRIMPVDCNLTFADLDTGDNRVVVDISKEQGNNDVDDMVELNDKGDEGSAKKLPQKRSAEQDQKPLSLPKKKKKKVKVSAKVAAFEVPPPRNGSIYMKSEFVEVIRTFIPSNQQHIATNAILHRGYAGTAAKETLRRLVKKDARGEPIIDSPWTSSGRPPKVNEKEVNEIVEKIKREDLRIYDYEDVKNLLLETMMNRNVMDESKMSFSRQTIDNYFTLLKSKLSPMYWKKVEDE